MKFPKWLDWLSKLPKEPPKKFTLDKWICPEKPNFAHVDLRSSRNYVDPFVGQITTFGMTNYEVLGIEFVDRKRPTSRVFGSEYGATGTPIFERKIIVRVVS